MNNIKKFPLNLTSANTESQRQFAAQQQPDTQR